MLTFLLTCLLATASADANDSTTQRLDEVRRRLAWQDSAGAEQLAAPLVQASGPHQLEATYLLGLAKEMGHDPKGALELYDYALREWPDGWRTRDLLLRRAEALAAMDRLGAAQRALRKLGPSDRLTRVEQVKVELARGVWWLEAGKTRRGLRHLDGFLPYVSQEVAPWYQARAHTALIEVAAAQANDAALRGNPKHDPLAEATKAATIKAVEDRIKESGPLGQHVFTLDQLHDLASIWETLGDQLGEVRAPAEPSDSWHAEQRRKREVVYLKAYDIVELGLKHAARTRVRGPRLDTLLADRARLETRIESLDASDQTLARRKP